MKLPRFFVDRSLRRRMDMENTPLTRFKIRLARSVSDYEGAFRLVQSSYVAIGIENVLSSTVRITPQHVLPEAYVLLAEEGRQLVGTMTVTLDSPAGLPLDHEYPAPLTQLRQQGHRLCEFNSLAVVERCRSRGVTNLINMAAFTIAARKLQATHAVCGVHPKAIAHHRAAYNFTTLGGTKDHAKLVAPVVGLITDLGRLHRFLARAYPEALPTGSLAADHFFGERLDCIDLPEGSHEQLVRWKLSREVFQEIFQNRSDRLATLDLKTREYLQQLRTPTTIGACTRADLAVVAGGLSHGW